MLELLVIAAIVAGFLYASDRKDKRHAEQVQQFCQRIQAPEQAVLEHAAIERTDGPLYEREDDFERARLELLIGAE